MFRGHVFIYSPIKRRFEGPGGVVGGLGALAAPRSDTGIGLCGLQGASRGLQGGSRGLLRSPVDDGTDDTYIFKVSKYDIGKNILMFQRIDHKTTPAHAQTFPPDY